MTSENMGSGPRRALPARRPARLRIAAIVAAACLVLTALGLGLARLVDPPRRPAGPGQPCADASMVTVDPAYSALFQSLGSAYVAATKDACPPIGIQVMASSVVAREGLGQAKAWIPEDATWQGMVTGQAAGLRDAKATNFARTPLVLVTPQEASDALGQPLAGKTLTDLITLRTSWTTYKKPDWGNLKLVIPDPNVSAIGALGFRSLARQVSGGQGAPDNPLKGSAEQRDMAKTEQRVMKWTSDGSDVLRYLQPAVGDASYREKSGPRSGLTSEYALLSAADKAGPIATEYVEGGSIGLQVPIIVPNGDRNVEDFVRWLTSADGQRHLAEGGLRSGGAAPAKDKLNAVGIHRSPAEFRESSLDDRKQGGDWWNKFHHRESVLMVLDLSGSMKDPVSPSDPQSRLDVVKRVVLDSWNVWPPGTANGLMTFRTEQDEPKVNVVMPLEPDTSADWSENHAKYESQVKGLSPGGWTPLFQAITEAYKHNMDHYQPGYRNRIIVLTDGRNEVPRSSVTYEEMIAALPKEISKEEPINFTFVTISPEQGDYDGLKQIAEATHGTAVWIQDPKEISSKLQEILYG